MASLTERLRGHRRVGLDSMVMIYAFEAAPTFAQSCQSLLELIGSGKAEAVTSVVSIHETLIRPLRMKQTAIAAEYLRWFHSFPNLVVLPVNDDVAIEAARLRAAYARLKAADSFQLAAALVGGATAFVTADRRLAGIKELKIIQLG